MAIINDNIAEQYKTRRVICELREGMIAKIKKMIHESWLARGGCEKCNGRGWIVTWDTMDSMTGCYAEYGKCPNEKCTTSTVGADLSYHDKYDDQKGPGNLLPKSQEYKTLIVPLDEQIAAINARIADLERKYTPDKGSYVKVLKGRKVKIGTEGVVVGFHDNAWGRKCGIKDNTGTVHWTSTDNVCVIDHP